MLNPETIPEHLRQRALLARSSDELDPANLFNITWKNESGEVNKLVFPSELTGIDANLIILLGKDFPSGSHKVGPAYATLIEGYVDGHIIPGEHTILGPSTGNFGIGVAYICNLMGFKGVVIMPDNMSRERYERIRKYGGELLLTPGSESDVILTLEKTHELQKDPANRALAQFELLPNYRFHRHVTGNSAIQAVKGIGNGRIACFTSAPGSAGTISAGDEIKVAFPEAKVAALEPYECSTLATGGLGQHRIEGIGDKMCTLIHNVLTTDFIVNIYDEQTIQGLKVLRDGTELLVEMGVPRETAEHMRDCFGPSGVCNVIGAIKMAKYLKLGPGDNVVTIATDGFDRYHSVINEMEHRYLGLERHVLERWVRDVFLRADDGLIFDVRRQEQKERLFAQKERDWLKFGYSREYLNSMKSMEFWELEYAKIEEYDRKILALR
jgi:cysteine synthase